MSESYPAVKLTEFQTHIYQRLNEFRQQNHLCDVTIDVNGKHYPCHRVILTAASPYFETVLNENSEQNSKSNVIALSEEIEAVAVEEILNTIYSSQLNLLPENVYFILKASHIMQLEMIRNACVSWMMKNTDIHYLIDACLFAKNISEEKLYVRCVDTISNDLILWSKTDAFRDVPFEVLNSILLKCRGDNNEEMVVVMIIKWSKYHNASSAEVQALLRSAKLKSKIVITPIMSDLIIHADGDLFANEKPKTTEKKYESNVLFDFNLYLNAVDVKTGVKGWGVMKMNESFDEYVMSNFYVTKSSQCRKVVKVGKKLYCFEYESPHRTNVFYCYDECNNKTELKLPKKVFSSFDMVTIENNIYFLGTGDNNQSIWSYDCKADVWKTSFEQKHETQRIVESIRACNTTNLVRVSYCNNCKFGSYRHCINVVSNYEPYTEMKPALYQYTNNSHAFTTSDGILYVIAKSITNNDVILSFDSRSPTVSKLTNLSFPHKNAAVCAFDNKITLSGSNDDGVLSNTFNIFDITARKWLTDIQPMNFDRANHNLFHHSGCLYAVENGRPLVSNEKYDLKSNAWINIPSLPKRILVDNTNDVLVVSTADVFGADVNPIQG